MFQDPRKFKFSSDYPLPYFTYQLNRTIVATSSSSTVQIPHNLPFIPMLIGYWGRNSDLSDSSDIGAAVYVDNGQIGGTIIKLNARADNNNIYLDVNNGPGSPVTIYVKLYAYVPPDYDGNATAVTDSTNFLFSTDYNYLELAKVGTTTDHDDAVEIQHGLNYVPQCKLWKKYKSGDNILIEPVLPYLSIDDEFFCNDQYWVDNEKLHIGGLAQRDIAMYYHIYTSEG